MEENPISQTNPFNHWNHLSSDLIELILSLLPIRSAVVAASVCKTWRSIITSSSFTARFSAVKPPWFFLCGQNNISPKNNQAFAFDPEANHWIVLPNSPIEFFTGCNGFFFANSSQDFTFKPVLGRSWRQTSPLRFSRCSPLVGVYQNGLNNPPGFIVVGGVRFIGGLVDIEDRLAAEVYNPYQDCWELCPPLPADFRSGNSSQWSCSALFQSKFYVFGIYSCFISAFDLEKRVWSEVQTLRPPGVLFSFLISCQDRLVLAGLCGPPHKPSFNLWRIDDKTMEFREIALMPRELLDFLIGGGYEEDDTVASLKCVGLGNFVYVFNEEHHRNYPACVCEINGECNWRKVPSLPVPHGFSSNCPATL